MDVQVFAGPDAPTAEIVSFLSALDFAPAQHDPRWSSVFRDLPNEDFHILVARDGARIVAVSTFTIFHGSLGPIVHANPYMGYGGCSCLPARQAEAVAALMGLLLEKAREAGCLTVSVATPPFNEQTIDLYIRALEPDYRFDNFYQYHVLECHPFDKLKGRHRQAFQREIRRAESAGVQIIRAESPSQFEGWARIYERRYADIGATPLPRKFQEMLWRVFSPCEKARLDLAYVGDELLGGTLFLEGTGVVDYFSSAFTAQGMRLHAGTLILHRAFTDFITRGIRRFNWQSSPNRDGGVYQFKQRWGASEGAHCILTAVLGDEKVLTSRPLAEIREAYPLHFVLPYDLWGGGHLHTI